MKIKTKIFAVPRLIFLPTILFIVISFSCTRNDIVPYSEITDEIRSINNFIWENMDTYYLWRDYMPSNIDPEAQPDPALYFHELRTGIPGILSFWDSR